MVLTDFKPTPQIKRLGIVLMVLRCSRLGIGRTPCSSRWVSFQPSTFYGNQHVVTVLFFLFFFFLQQIINQHAQQIAATYTTSDKAQWVDAALKLRLAYWDWAENSVPPPQVISLDQVEITMPSGQRSNVTNPLRGYRFHPMPSDMSRPYRNWPRTLRQPTGPRSDATDDVPLLIK